MPEIKLHNAFVLHARAYHDTSLLVDLFTPDLGKVAIIARGAKRPKSPFKGLLQPFIPLCVSFFGRGELFTLRMAEQQGKALHLSGQSLFSGLYLNELLMRILHRYDPHPELYEAYWQTINNLVNNVNLALTLRRFEKKLLSEVGYGFHFQPVNTEANIQEDHYYSFSAEQGFTIIQSNHFPSANRQLFSGKSLLAIAEERFDEEEVLQDAQRLFRLALLPLLGNKPLNSLLLLE